MGFNERLDELLQSKQMTAKQLTEMLGIGATAVSDWKRGKSTPSPITLIGISQIMDVSVDFLLTGKEFISKEERAQLSLDQQKALDYYDRLSEENKDFIKGEMVRLYREEEEVKRGEELSSTLETLEKNA